MTFKANSLIYIANSYSSKKEDKDLAGLERAQRRALESYVGGALKKKYKDHTFILPIAMSAAMVDVCSLGSGFETWERDDFTLISKCDAIWVLMSEGWNTSVGVKAEIKFAKELKIPVRYLNKNTLEVIDDTLQDDIIVEYLNDYKL